MTFFEVAQGSLAILLGFGGAYRVLAAHGGSVAGLGVLALVLGTACYAVAFAFAERRAGQARELLLLLHRRGAAGPGRRQRRGLRAGPALRPRRPRSRRRGLRAALRPDDAARAQRLSIWPVPSSSSCKNLEMVGHCFIAMNNPRLAVKQLERGLEISQTSGGDSMGIHYNLGLAYEALEDMDKAREHYEEVYIVDVTFRDISDKMKKFSTVS